jgi:hypothetical protein
MTAEQISGEVKLDWASSEVHDGRLEVGLRGELPRGWKASFARTVALLAGRDWGNVRLKKNRIQVAEVSAGSEERLHHFLESAVFQANQLHGDQAEATLDEVDEQTESERLDAEMTERFRGYGAQATT